MVFCRAVSHAYVVLFSVDDNLAGERRKERKKQYSNTKQWAPNTKRERAHESTTRTLKMLLFWASHGRIKSECRANDAPCSASILVVGGWLAGCKTNIEHNRIEFNSNFVCVCVCACFVNGTSWNWARQHTIETEKVFSGSSMRMQFSFGPQHMMESNRELASKAIGGTAKYYRSAVGAFLVHRLGLVCVCVCLHSILGWLARTIRWAMSLYLNTPLKLRE